MWFFCLCFWLCSLVVTSFWLVIRVAKKLILTIVFVIHCFSGGTDLGVPHSTVFFLSIIYNFVNILTPYQIILLILFFKLRISLIRNGDKLPSQDHLIVQEYIEKPFLMEGYKFDLRIYILITSCDPLKIFLYHDGLVRMGTEKYIPPNESNLVSDTRRNLWFY